jgi:F0F1-type ATP synthase alpha subunit
VLKQAQYAPLPVERQVFIIYAGANGFLDDIDVADIRRFEADMYRTSTSTTRTFSPRSRPSRRSTTASRRASARPSNATRPNSRPRGFPRT